MSATSELPGGERLTATGHDPETEAAIEALQDGFGISEQQALDTLAFEERYSILATQLEQKHEGNYAGAWIAHDDGGILVIALTSPHKAEADIPPDLVERVRTVTVSRSLAELLSMADDLNTRIDTAVGFASPDLENNGLWIDVLYSEMDAVAKDVSLTAAVDTFRESGVSVAYRDLDALPQDESCSSTDNCNPLVAGAAINGPRTCSAGFKVKRISTGKYGMLTAKHCDPGTYSHFIYNVLTSTGGTSSSTSDVRFLATAGGLSINDDVYSFGSLKDMSGFANPVLNGTVCRGGRYSSDCGTANNLYVTGNRFSVANLKACPGDSGSPHYLGSTGYGTHTGSSDVTSCPGPWNETSYAVKLTYSIYWLGLVFSTS